MHTMRRMLFAMTLLALMAPPAFALDVIPYQADGWSYQVMSHSSELGWVFMDPNFDDQLWATGRAAFGDASGCSSSPLTHTPWPINTDLLLRYRFESDPLAPTSVEFAVDNDATIWVNGVQIVAVTHEGCAAPGDWSVAIPPGVLHAGVNVIAVRAVDRGGISFFDLRVIGDLPVPTRTRTWGQLKLFHH